MSKKIVKTISVFLLIIMVLGLFSACNNANDSKEEILQLEEKKEVKAEQQVDEEEKEEVIDEKQELEVFYFFGIPTHNYEETEFGTSNNWTWYDIDLYDTLVEFLLEKGCEPTSPLDIGVFHEDIKYTEVLFDTIEKVFSVGFVNLGIYKSSSYKITETEFESEDFAAIDEGFFLEIPDNYWIRPGRLVQTWSWEENIYDNICSILDQQGYGVTVELEMADGELYSASTILFYDTIDDQYKVISQNFDGSGDYRRYQNRDREDINLIYSSGPPFFHFDFDSYEDYRPEYSIERWFWRNKKMIDEISNFFEGEGYFLASQRNFNLGSKQNLIYTNVAFDAVISSYIIEFFELDGSAIQKIYTLLEPDDPRSNVDFEINYWGVPEDEIGLNGDGFLYWTWEKTNLLPYLKIELEQRDYRVKKETIEHDNPMEWYGTRIMKGPDEEYYIEHRDGKRTQYFLHMVSIYLDGSNPNNSKKDFYGLIPDYYEEKLDGSVEWIWKDVNWMSNLQSILEQDDFRVRGDAYSSYTNMPSYMTRVRRNTDNIYFIEYNDESGYLTSIEMVPADFVEPNQNNSGNGNNQEPEEGNGNSENEYIKDFYGLIPDLYEEKWDGSIDWLWRNTNKITDIQNILEQKGYRVRGDMRSFHSEWPFHGTRIMGNNDGTYIIQYNDESGYLTSIEMVPADYVEPGQDNNGKGNNQESEEGNNNSKNEYKRDFYGLTPDEYIESGGNHTRWSWNGVNLFDEIQNILIDYGYTIYEENNRSGVMVWQGSRVTFTDNEWFEVQYFDGSGNMYSTVLRKGD